MNYIIISIAILFANFTYVYPFNSIGSRPRTVNKVSAEVHDEYSSELSHYSSLLEDCWNNTRFLIQDAQDANQLPVQDVVAAATQNITELTASFDKEVAHNCTLETQRVIRLLYHQATSALLGCIAIKPQVVLVNVLDVQDAVDDAYQRAVDNERQYNVCSNKANDAEQQACQQKQLEVLQAGQAAAVRVIDRAKAALAVAETMPALLKKCTDPIAAAIREAILQVVNAVKDCPKNANIQQ